jgi:hypothetical protein
MQAFQEGLAGRGERYLYSRDGNPIVAALEGKLAMVVTHAKRETQPFPGGS